MKTQEVNDYNNNKKENVEKSITSLPQTMVKSVHVVWSMNIALSNHRNEA